MKIKDKGMDRRTFLKATGIGGASSALSIGLSDKVLSSESNDKSSTRAMPSRILGRTKFQGSILAQGGGVDFTINQNILRVASNMGINIWDSAPNYENGKSEIGIGQYFEKYPEERKKIFLISKPGMGKESELEEELKTSLERMKQDYLDAFMLHGSSKPEILTPELKASVERLKKQGRIKFFGFSCHANMEQMLVHAAKIGWIDVIMFSYNYNIMNNDGIKRAVDACKDADIGLIAMKSQALNAYVETPYRPLGEVKDIDLVLAESFMAKGFIAQQAKLKAIWTDERIHSVASQMKNFAVLKSNYDAATDSVQLTKSDMDMLNMLAKVNCSSYCNGCLSCELAMKSESRIHDIMRYMMYYNSYGEKNEARSMFSVLPESIRKNLTSRDYSPAERACPNKIKISEVMKEAARVLS